MAKIFEHFWIKVIALVLGLLLWFHVATEKVYNYQLRLPLNEVVLDNDLTLAQAPPESLMIMVSATGKQLMRQKWRERGVKVVANQFGTGRHQLQLSPSNTSLASPARDISLEDIVSPKTLTLMVDRIGEEHVKVQPDLITEPEKGYAVSRISTPEPSEVTITGPQSQIRKITEISTVQKELSGLRNDVTLTLPLAKPDIFGVTLDPDSVSLTVEIVAVKTRVFENVPIVIYNTPSGQTAISSPSALTIELTGPPADIDLLNRNAIIASADFTKLSTDGKAPVKIDCPSKFRVKNSSADSVSISVQ
jgi:YbbR domain-containing protein